MLATIREQVCLNIRVSPTSAAPGKPGILRAMRLTSLFILICVGLACGPDKTDTETDGTTTSGTATDGTTTAARTTGGESGAPTTSEETGETGETGPGTTTGLGDGCEVFTQQAECEQDPDCMAVVGEAFDFAGCMPGQTFIACIPAMPCDSVITNICQDKPGQEVYKIPDGCIPPGFFGCGPADFPMCGDFTECEQLPQQGCIANPDCTAIMGAAHMDVGGEICVDFGAQVFLACAQGDLACPPVISTVCPEGQPDMVFDTPSGCIPAGFVPCDMPAPECQ